MKYNPDEARQLKNYNEIPDTVKIEEDNEIAFDATVETGFGSDSGSDSDTNGPAVVDDSSNESDSN